MPKPVGPAAHLNAPVVQDTAPSQPPVSTPAARGQGAADTSSRITAADQGQSARGKFGKAPDLIADWTEAAVRCAAEAQAVQQKLSAIQAEFTKSVAASPTPLDDDAQAELWEKIAGKHAKPFIPGLVQSISASPKTIAAAVKEVMEGETQRVSQLRDPFTPVAMNDPKARARETVLWENARVMVLVDAFVGAPKALVIPKQRFTYPTEAPAVLLTEMSQIAFVVGQAMAAAARSSAPLATAIGASPAKIWINPPPQLGVAQLHVHVLPELPAWKRAMPKEWAAADKAVTTATQGDDSIPGWQVKKLVNQEFQRAIAPVVAPYYAAVTAELGKRPELAALSRP